MSNALKNFFLDGKVIIITGGAGLMGEKHAEAIAEARGVPVLWDINLDAANAVANTISKSLINGCDMQWQPSVLFWEGINHYKKFLANNGIGDFLCQNGEYAHLLQILNYPFTLFEWETARILWLILNIFFAFSIPFLICRSLRLDTYKSVLLFLIC